MQHGRTRRPEPSASFLKSDAIALSLAVLLTAAAASAQSIFTIAGGGTPDGRPATAGGLNHPGEVTFDRGGNLYIADQSDNRIRKVAAGSGIITTIAGIGSEGFLGDGGPATASSLGAPWGLAIDNAGNIYTAEQSSGRVRKISAETGIITTIAGNGGTGGPQGDGGPGTAAQLSFPTDVKVDAAGNVYVADSGHDRIRRIDAKTLIIGNYVGGGTSVADGVPASSAKFNTPRGMFFDSAGNFYVAEMSGQKVRKVDGATGLITTVAGTGTKGFSGDGGPATAAQLSDPFRVVADDRGNVYIADRMNNRIRRVTPDGIIQTIAGNGTAGWGGDGGPATAAKLYWPNGLALGPDGALYIAQYHDPAIRRVDLTSGIITTVAGTGGLRFLGDGGPATSGGLFTPRGLAIDAKGNLFVADSINERIRMVDAATGIMTTVAGTGVSGFSGDGGPATAAMLSEPWGVTLDAEGNLYIADKRNSRIRKVDAATGTIRTIVGSGSSAGFSGDGGPATAAKLNWPYSTAFDRSSNLYIADTWNYRIRRVDAVSGVITTVAGKGDAGLDIYDDGKPATNATLSKPYGVAVDANGDVYIDDWSFHRIRKVTTSTGIINTIFKVGSFPSSFVFDGGGNLYISDEFDQKVYKAQAPLWSLSLVAGKGEATIGTGVFSGDGGPATRASLSDPSGVAMDAAGNLFISDSENNRVRAVYACVDIDAPHLMEPSNGAVLASRSPRLVWRRVGAAFRYDVFLDRTPTPATLFAADLAEASIPIANLDPGLTYYWRVVAKGDPYCNPPKQQSSETRSFTTNNSCIAPRVAD